MKNYCICKRHKTARHKFDIKIQILVGSRSTSSETHKMGADSSENLRDNSGG